MKTAVFEKIGKLSIQDKPIPQLAPGDLLIEVNMCGICASDVAALNGDVTDYSPPVVMGHELAGVVVDGQNDHVKLGAKVTLNPMLSCGTCKYCRSDLDKYCDKIVGIGHDVDGGYAEYVHMPRHAIDNGKLIPVPDTTSAENLLFLEPLGCCLNAMNETIFADNIAILGAGPIGLMFTQLTKRAGLKTYILEPMEHRRTAANQMGASATFGITDTEIEELIELTHGGVDTVISATVNNQRAIDLAFKVVRRGGCINFFGLAPQHQNIHINIEHFHYAGHKLMASWAFSRENLNEARRTILDKEINLTPLITHRFPIENTADAFDNTRHRLGLKSVLVNE